MHRFCILLVLAGCSYGGYQPEYDALKKSMKDHPAYTGNPTGENLLALFEREELPDISGPVKLDELVTFAIARNPDLRAALKHLEAAIEQIPQSASAPDPQLRIGVTTTVQDLFDVIVGWLGMFMQTVFWPGELETRARFAIENAAEAAEKVREFTLHLRLMVAREVSKLHYLDRALSIVKNNQTLIETVEKIAKARYEAGQVPQQDVLKVRVQAQQLEHRVIVIRRQRRQSEARLNALLGRRDMARIGHPFVGEDPVKIEPIEELMARAFELRPDVAAMTHRMRRALAGVHLAELDWWPDLTPRALYEPVPRGDDRIHLAFSMNLAFLRPDKRSAAERQAKAVLGAEWHRYQAGLNGIARDVTAAHALATETHDSLKLFKDKLVPDSKRTYESALAGYRAGSVDFGTLLDALVSAQNIEEQYHRLMGDHLAGREELRRAVGDKP